MPNLKRLELGSTFEVNTPMLPTKFLNLKHLIIQVHQKYMEHESVFEGSSHLRQLPECRHERLKSFEVIGFSSAKGLVELTCCIVKNAISLKRLTLDTLHGYSCLGGPDDSDYCDNICCPVSEDVVVEEAFRGVAAIRKYIDNKVPPTAELIVLEPCPRCHTAKWIE
nr:unnamed protein product [Digitaria exilis]